METGNWIEGDASCDRSVDVYCFRAVVGTMTAALQVPYVR